MAGNNRYLKGKQSTQLTPVRGNIAIDAGDLLFLNATKGSLGAGKAEDSYAYPISSLAPATGGTNCAKILTANFLGVALESSPSGVTENITVAKSGVFRYPLHAAYQTGAVTIGASISFVSNELSAGVSVQNVVSLNSGYHGSTAYVGYCIKTESAATYVDINIQTAYGPFGVI